MHRHHHCSKKIRLQHRVPRFKALHTLVAPQDFEASHEIVQLLAFDGVDDADAFQRDIQCRGHVLDLSAVAYQNRRAQPQRIVLPRRLEDAGLDPFRKNDPLGMPLQLFDDTAYKSHATLSSRHPRKSQLKAVENEQPEASANLDKIFSVTASLV